jgi:hypothetical protein
VLQRLHAARTTATVLPAMLLVAACAAISSRSQRQLIGNHLLVAACAIIFS